MSRFVLSAERLHANLSLARQWAPEGARLRAMIKANAYGHGLEESIAIFAANSDELGVATVEEGLQIRSCLDRRIPIYVMSGEKDWGDPQYLDAIRQARLVPVISSLDELRLFLDRAGRTTSLQIELKLDTGMGRLGIQEGEMGELGKILGSLGETRVEGFLTHFASSDEPSPESTLDQERCFWRMLSELPPELIQAASKHSCNSGALMTRGLGHTEIGEHTSVVRPGLMLYGAAPSRYLQSSSCGELLTPIGRWLTRVIEVRSVAPGHAVGYGSTWRVEGKQPARLAVLPVGYADGFRRGLGGRGQVLIRGGFFPVVGRVSMDMISVHVNDRVNVGDEAVLLGSQKGELGSHEITAWDWADLCDTIPYEIWTGIGSRVQRQWAENGARP